MFDVKMIMVDECGREVVVDTFTVENDLDKEYMKVWESMKIEKAKERFPEAYGFYFEDSRDYTLHEYDECDWKEKSLDDMILCDDSGVCAGESCPMYWKCQH